MKRALIIGYGNPLRGDDGFGWHAARRLGQMAHQDPTHVVAVHQLTPELVEPIGNAELVIFIDASHEEKPGTWRCKVITAETGRANSLAHYFTPTILLGYAQTVYDVSPSSLMITVGGESFDYCETLTPRAEAALPEVIQHVLGYRQTFNLDS